MIMKKNGMPKSIDSLGRLVIPNEIRHSLEIGPNDKVEIFLEGDKIVIKKHVPSCIFCGSDEGLADFAEKKICKSCAAKIGKL